MKQQQQQQQPMTPEEKIEEQQAEVRHTIRMHQFDQDRNIKQLKSRIQGLVSDLQHALIDIEQGNVDHLNSLGIVQGQGPEIDKLIVEIHLNGQWLREMQRIVPVKAE